MQRRFTDIEIYKYRDTISDFEIYIDTEIETNRCNRTEMYVKM